MEFLKALKNNKSEVIEIDVLKIENFLISSYLVVVRKKS